MSREPYSNAADRSHYPKTIEETYCGKRLSTVKIAESIDNTDCLTCIHKHPGPPIEELIEKSARGERVYFHNRLRLAEFAKRAFEKGFR